jgi:hypothetical protein
LGRESISGDREERSDSDILFVLLREEVEKEVQMKRRRMNPKR